jgi:hypothetical protein
VAQDGSAGHASIPRTLMITSRLRPVTPLYEQFDNRHP